MICCVVAPCRASSLCRNAKSLIFGVSLTVPEEDRKTVKANLKMMTERIEAKLLSFAAKMEAIN